MEHLQIDRHNGYHVHSIISNNTHIFVNEFTAPKTLNNHIICYNTWIILRSLHITDYGEQFVTDNTIVWFDNDSSTSKYLFVIQTKLKHPCHSSRFIVICKLSTVDFNIPLYSRWCNGEWFIHGTQRMGNSPRYMPEIIGLVDRWNMFRGLIHNTLQPFTYLRIVDSYFLPFFHTGCKSMNYA